MRAIKAAFVEIKTLKFVKKVGATSVLIFFLHLINIQVSLAGFRLTYDHL